MADIRLHISAQPWCPDKPELGDIVKLLQRARVFRHGFIIYYPWIFSVGSPADTPTPAVARRAPSL